MGAERDGAGSVVERVDDQIGERLFDPGGVGERVESVVCVDADRTARELGACCEANAEPIEQRAPVEQLGGNRMAATVGASELEEIVCEMNRLVGAVARRRGGPGSPGRPLQVASVEPRRALLDMRSLSFGEGVQLPVVDEVRVDDAGDGDAGVAELAGDRDQGDASREGDACGCVAEAVEVHERSASGVDEAGAVEDAS